MPGCCLALGNCVHRQAVQFWSVEAGPSRPDGVSGPIGTRGGGVRQGDREPLSAAVATIVVTNGELVAVSHLNDKAVTTRSVLHPATNWASPSAMIAVRGPIFSPVQICTMRTNRRAPTRARRRTGPLGPREGWPWCGLGDARGRSPWEPSVTFRYHVRSPGQFPPDELVGVCAPHMWVAG